MDTDLTPLDITGMDTTLMGMNMSPSHLLWSTMATLLFSHLGANYLKDITPRGYMFWFTILNLILGFLFM